MSALGAKTYSSAGEKLDWTYYDSLVLAAAGTEFSLFQIPIGGGATPKTLADTNVNLGGMIPNGQNFTIRAIGAEYLSHNVKASADIDLLYNFLRVATVRFFITGKDALYSKPLTEIMGIPLLFHSVPAVAGNNENIFSMGRFVGINPLNVPLILDEQTSYEVRVNIPAALGAISLVADIVRISLRGILIRRS